MALVGAVALAGCSPSGGSEDGEELGVDPEDDISRSEQAFVSVRVDGDLSFEWEQESPLQILKVTPPERMAHLLSIGILNFVPVGDGPEQFRFAFDLVGGYDGPGTYEIRGPEEQEAAAEGQSELGLPPSGLFSVAFLLHLRLIDPGSEQPYVPENYEDVRAFDHPLQPCVVEVGEAEASGSLTCPELADADGNTVSLAVTWRPSDE